MLFSRHSSAFICGYFRLLQISFDTFQFAIRKFDLCRADVFFDLVGIFRATSTQVTSLGAKAKQWRVAPA